ncbi:MAG: hypothetical protein HRU15_12110 [Planctomycetes bacterium]|nr:hypothetical protein [Planctomycetota bacterium]
MLQKLLHIVCIAALSCSSTAAMEQVTPVEGSFLLSKQPFPPLDSVKNKNTQNFPVYGIYTWMSEYKMLRQEIKQVGWKTLRVSGPLNDDDLKILFDDGLNFSFMMPAPIIDGKRAKRDQYESDELYIQESVAAAHAFFDRYGSGGTFYTENPQYTDRHIPYMQLRNEPNFHYMYTKGTEAEREKLYAALAPLLANVIRERSPHTKVIGFTAGGASAGDIRFIDHVLKINPKALTEVDVFATHPYVHPAAPETNSIKTWGNFSIAGSLDKLRTNFALYKRADIPVWYTEGGWIISQADGAAYKKPLKECVSPELQAAYSCRYYALALRLGVDCVTNMFITDTDGYPGGFFDRLNENAWRPSAKAVQTMIRLLPHPALRGTQCDGTDGNYIYEFARNARKKNTATVIMAYRAQGPVQIEIKVKWKKAEIVDMLGGTTAAIINNGIITTEIGPLPIYIQESQ